ncbi:MAG TPA: hypothetical protein PK306_03445 [Aquabacterium sp.]|nr:hypothetical protein [Aquabacterium sp.]
MPSPPERRRRPALFASGAVLTAVLSLGTQLLMERGLGPSGFARWALCSALVTLFGVLATFGLNSLLLADHYRGRLVTAAGRRAVLRYALACTGLAVLGMLALYAGAPFRVERSALDVAMAMALVLLMLPVTAVYAYYQICGLGLELAFWPVLQNLARFAAALAVLWAALDASQAIAVWLGGVVLLALAAVPGLARASAVLAAGPQPAAPSALADPLEAVAVAGTGRRARRFGWMEFFDALDLKVALPIAALMLPDVQVAAVGLGLLLMNAIYYFPYVFVMRYLLPAVHRADAAGSGLPRLSPSIDRVALLASAVTGVAVAVAAPGVVAWVAAGDYTGQRAMFTAAGLATVPLVMSTVGAGAFLGESQADLLLRLRRLTTLVFLVVLLVLIGPMGAAAPFVALIAGRGWLWWTLWRWRRRLLSAPEGALP